MKCPRCCDEMYRSGVVADWKVPKELQMQKWVCATCLNVECSLKD